MGRTLREQQQLLESLRTDVRALRGQVQLVNERTGRIAGEQSAMAQEMERTLAEQRKIARQVEDERAALRRFRLESANDLDKMRTRITDLDKLLRSPISRMPDKTAADAALRQSYFHLLNGEFDIAASQFQQFMKKHPKDPRRIEALYRRGQAFFLLRRYDHALIPFFEVVDKAPRHPMATPARWMLARALEETGDLKLAREFYAQLISGKTPYAADATRRLAFINKLFPRSQ